MHELSAGTARHELPPGTSPGGEEGFGFVIFDFEILDNFFGRYLWNNKKTSR